ncbi:MAG TPA: hypothetical protein VFT67_11750 [Jatrophihabitantaceae bacterium]|nr:hypothetical protein [Jatrophihabitantaceae bacterium]
MNAGTTPSANGGDGARPHDNGLPAVRYVPLMDVSPEFGDVLLAALGRSRIAAYLGDSPDHPAGRRLFVAAEERVDARTIVSAVIRATGGTPPPATEEPPEPRPDPLAGVDTDAAFADLIADWHVDTVTAIRNAEKALSREDADWRARLEQTPADADELAWLDEQHYVPPVPPPLPRFAPPTLVAILVLAVSVLLLVFGTHLALGNRFVMFLGVCGVLVSTAILVMRLRARPDDDDDGAIV